MERSQTTVRSRNCCKKTTRQDPPSIICFFHRDSVRPVNAWLPTLLLSPLPDPPRVGLDDLVGSVCSPTRMNPLIPVNLRPPPLLFEVIDVAALFKAVGRLCGAADNVGELRERRCQSIRLKSRPARVCAPFSDTGRQASPADPVATRHSHYRRRNSSRAIVRTCKVTLALWLGQAVGTHWHVDVRVLSPSERTPSER